MSWEVDWSHAKNTGQKVMARNPQSHQARTREWHLTSTGYLREAGVNTPTYRRDSWEVDWTQRKDKLVWARNPSSKMPAARDWHWVDFHTLNRSGIQWQPKTQRTGRHLTKQGYVRLTRRGMTAADIELAEAHGLFLGTRKIAVLEHQLVAVKKYGCIPDGMVVRHRNGVKSDNHPDNLVLGTTQENTMDHEQARLAAMFWREYAMTAIALTMRVLMVRGWKPQEGV